MRFLVSALWVLSTLLAQQHPAAFRVVAGDQGAWPRILSSVGFLPGSPTRANIFVCRSSAPAYAEWPVLVEHGGFLILEGSSPLAESFGFHAGKERVRVASVEDLHRPGLSIVWRDALDLPRYEVPKEARVFARERWTGAPLLAGFRKGSGAVLWVAAPPGERGYERFPYILQALADFGLEPMFRDSRLWAFFDSSYRTRVDVDYFAQRWRSAGISALHVAAWHFYDPDPKSDEYLRKLIAACHRHGILVYAWLELPHVSDRFWEEHPAWREKTALLQDAQLDWRKLMNLSNRDCFHAVSAGVHGLLGRFDWDGVNLAELYFESLEGVSNPARFTPMNDDVRALFLQSHGFDPIELFRGRKDRASLRAFLDFRAGLAARMQKEWLAEVAETGRESPGLDTVLTHVDDRFDTGMRDAIGADVARVLPQLDHRRFTLLIEDPATVWNLGPQRYPEIARRYRALTRQTGSLAIDINIAERYQNVYPTKQQTGTELFQLVHVASASFPRVALYFEASILAPDWKLLPYAAATVKRADVHGRQLVVDSAGGVGVRWHGPALVDGKPWPVADDSTLWLPAGAHTIEPARRARGARILDFNGVLHSARLLSDHAIEVSYESSSRALAVLDRKPLGLKIDGVRFDPVHFGARVLALPRGKHIVTIKTE